MSTPVVYGDPSPVPLFIDDGGNMVPAFADDPCECCELEPSDCDCPPCSEEGWEPTKILTISGLTGDCAIYNGSYLMTHGGCTYDGSGSFAGGGGTITWSARYHPCGDEPWGSMNFSLDGTPICNPAYSPSPSSQPCMGGFSVELTLGLVCCTDAPQTYTMSVS